MKKRPDQRLSATFCSKVRTPGRYGDGGRGSHGLYFRVWIRASGRVGKAWAQRIRINGRVTCLGLGVFPIVTLAEAREKALENRRATAQGQDPRRGPAPNFRELAERVIALHAKSWKKGSQLPRDWRSSFQRYADPINNRPVDEITRADVLRILTPIWHTRPAAAKTVLQRIGTVLRYAVAQELVEYNAAEASAIQAALPKANGGRGHHKALPHSEVAAALAKVRASGSQLAARLAVEFLALTACRVSEVLGARWTEIDLRERLWTVPATRMKAKREFRVSLSGRALEILLEARELSGGGKGLIFPSGVTGRAISRRLPGEVFRRCGVDSTIHGLRSSFADWAAESGVDRTVTEAALAHAVQNKVEAAYRRTDLLVRRRQLMDSWAAYVVGG